MVAAAASPTTLGFHAGSGACLGVDGPDTWLCRPVPTVPPRALPTKCSRGAAVPRPGRTPRSRRDSRRNMPPKKGKAAAAGAAAKPILGRPTNNVSMGIVGLPNIGKSTFFNLMCNMSVAAENYPFCTIDPTDARVPVPVSLGQSERWRLCSLFPGSSLPYTPR